MIEATITAEDPTQLPGADQALLDDMKRRIEDLAGRVDHVDETNPKHWSHTIGGTAFTTICNGQQKAEGARAVSLQTLADMCNDTVAAARRLRRAINGPSTLTWRDISYEPGVLLWVRLAFEAQR